MARLAGIQRALADRLSVFLTNLEAQLNSEYQKVLHQEELLWFQKSRIQWLTAGDRATRFFHATLICKRKRNRIERLRLRDGTWSSDERVGKGGGAFSFSRPFLHY